MAQHSLREALLNAATQEFHEHGYNATGVSTIAARATAPKGSFYNHFRSKEAMAVEALDSYVATNGRLDVLEDTALTPVDRIFAYFVKLAENHREWEYRRGCMLGNFSAEVAGDVPKLRDAIKLHLGRQIAAVERALYDATAQGARLPARPGVIAALIIDGWQGALLRSKAFASGAPLAEYIQTLLPLMLGELNESSV